jgi:cytidyltransferase-like protein
MLVSTAELERHRGAVAMVDGGFDPLHSGHVEYFRAAAALGLPVLCNVSGDEWIARKHPPLLPQEERAAVIDAIRYVDLTHVAAESTESVLRRLRPRYYVKGADWRDRLPEGEVRACSELGIEVVFVDTVTGSSSAILDAYQRRLSA